MPRWQFQEILEAGANFSKSFFVEMVELSASPKRIPNPHAHNRPNSPRFPQAQAQLLWQILLALPHLQEDLLKPQPILIIVSNDTVQVVILIQLMS